MRCIIILYHYGFVRLPTAILHFIGKIRNEEITIKTRYNLSQIPLVYAAKLFPRITQIILIL